MKKTIKKLLFIIPVIILVMIAMYLNTYYKADKSVYDLIESSSVDVKENKNGYLFDGEGKDNLIIFYPGAKVEAIAYTPLLLELAQNNIDCYLVKMPFNIAIFNSSAADTIIKNYKYDNYYMMGHSLGGAMASVYTSKNEDKVKGLILLAAYSTEKIKKVNTLSIYGDMDNVLNKENYNKNKTNINNITEYIIEGANHSGFAYYGEQKGDNKAAILKEEQIKTTTSIIINFITEK